MRIGIADPQARVRFGLRVLLEQQAGWSVIGEAASSQELLDLAEQNCPDMLLLDWDLQDMPMDNLIQRLRAQCQNIFILAISSRQEVSQAAATAGADGFTSKMETPEKLLRLIRNWSFEKPQTYPGGKTG